MNDDLDRGIDLSNLNKLSDKIDSILGAQQKLKSALDYAVDRSSLRFPYPYMNLANSNMDKFFRLAQQFNNHRTALNAFEFTAPRLAEKYYGAKDIIEIINSEFTIENIDYTHYTWGSEKTTEEETKQESSVLYQIDDSKRLKQIIQDVYNNNEKMYRISPREFEEMVAELLRKQNFDVQLTKQTRDGGYDILAINSLNGIPTMHLVECKKKAPNNPVGIEIVRSLMHVVDHNKASGGLICTTSYFSPGCKAHQRLMPYQLSLKDKNHLLEWIDEYMRKHS